MFKVNSDFQKEVCKSQRTIVTKIKAIINNFKVAKHKNKQSPLFNKMFDIVDKDAVPRHMQHIYEDQLKGADRNLKLRSYSLRSLGEVDTGNK